MGRFGGLILTLVTVAASGALSARRAEARPLSDGVTSTLSSNVYPGLIEAAGQENLSRRFGLMAGFERVNFAGQIYSGWELGSNWLITSLVGDRWKANAVASLGLGGLQGEGHGHSDAWTRLELDWENRQVLVAASGAAQRGTKMPQINEAQARAGYSPVVADMGSIQPWAVVSWLARSGGGGPQFFGLLRLVAARWWLEAGASLTSGDLALGFSVTL